MLPEFKEDMRALETLKTLMIYSRCLYKFEAGSLSLKKNYDGQPMNEIFKAIEDLTAELTS